MESTREQRRLQEVQHKIERLQIVSRDNFNISARYHALIQLEAILLREQRKAEAPVGTP